MITSPFLNLMTTVQSADFSKLVSGKGYVVIGGQIIFEKDGK